MSILQFSLARLFAVSCLAVFVSATSLCASPFLVEAQELVQRVVPSGRASDFVLESLPAENDRDVFEIESKGEKITLRGNNGVALASALRRYLKDYAHCQVSWCGDNLALPKPLPSVSGKIRVVSPYKYRVNFNYCTFSYTMAFWDWKRWEREIDWMAMNGINMPLAITGQEAVWQNTLRKFKMNDEEIRKFLCGPAFFGWQYMANLEGWGGPLPQQWIERNAELGKKILARERALGMTPILQGFSGFVPRDLKQKYPEAKIQYKPNWCAVFAGAAQLDPLDPLFEPMGKAFIEEQTKLFGTDHWYAADPFHESSPPSNAPDYLSNVAKAILGTMQLADPEAKIAMQNWSLLTPIIQNIPQDRLLILNLEGHGDGNGFLGHEWVRGVLHNYGGRIFLGGNIKNILARPDMVGRPLKSPLVGIGVFPEATEQNPAFYEAAYELGWMNKPPVFENWIQEYAHARYGIKNPATQAAWKILGETVYATNTEDGSAESPICSRPTLFPDRAGPNAGFKRRYDPSQLWLIWEKMLEAVPQLKDTDTYCYDLVDIARQSLADLSIPLQHDIAVAYEKGDKAALISTGRRFLDLASDMDRLLSTRKEFLFGKWVADARACGETPEQKALYERNARLLPTVWGASQSNALLFDYSNRQWAGLIKGYYIPRWHKFLTYLNEQPEKGPERFSDEQIKAKKSYNRPSDVANEFYKTLSAWEQKWCDGTESYPSQPVGNSVDVAAELYKKWKPLSADALKRYDPRTLKAGDGGAATIYSK